MGRGEREEVEHTFLGHCGYMVSRSFEGIECCFWVRVVLQVAMDDQGRSGSGLCWTFEQFLAERAERKEFKGQLINLQSIILMQKTTITWIRTVTINLGRAGRLID